MSFASDISAVTKSATGDAINGRTRLAGVYFVSTGSAGSIVLRTGGETGPVKLELATPPMSFTTDLIIPDNGILCEDGVHVTLTNVSSVTILFVGGAAA
jgi:hypothetical protein